VIVGGGAFAIQNARTMLMNGAKHVTIVHRSGLQVWPQCVNYVLSSEKDRKYSEYAEIYQKAAEWAGLSYGFDLQPNLAPLMHPRTKAQPTASDYISSPWSRWSWPLWFVATLRVCTKIPLRHARLPVKKSRTIVMSFSNVLDERIRAIP